MMRRMSAKAILVQIAMAHGIDPMRAIDDTLASDFLAMIAGARRRRLS